MTSSTPTFSCSRDSYLFKRYDESIKVVSFEELLMKELESLQKFFIDFSKIQYTLDAKENTIKDSSNEAIKLYLQHLVRHTMDLLLTTSCNDSGFDYCMFLQDYIGTFKTYVKQDPSDPSTVRDNLQRWATQLPRESYIISDID